MADLIDSYTTTTSLFRSLSSIDYHGAGQSFTNLDYDYNISSCKFYLKRGALAITGNAYAKLYAHSGTYGTSSMPTGSPLATSSAFDVSSLTTTAGWKEFIFSTTYKMLAGIYYEIVIEYTGGDANHYLMVNSDNTTKTHSGNACLENSSNVWNYYAFETPFYIYGYLAPAVFSPQLMMCS